ncbi:MAG TPA: DUF4097 family beta strand repeat-containing protein [Streptosporangiaceae bacterium]
MTNSLARPARRQPAQETQMHAFATPGPIAAHLNIPAGHIHVEAGDSDTTTVTIRPADPARARDVKLAARTTATYRDGTLRITTPAAHKVLGSTGALRVTVQVPPGSRVQARAASAQLTTAGPLGDITLDSAQATVTIGHAATARLTVTDADITIGRLNGDAEIRAVRGDIRVTQATRGALTLATQAGDITVGAALGTSATLDAGTTMGRIHNALANAGTPALTIHATTTTGDITARSL